MTSQTYKNVNIKYSKIHIFRENFELKQELENSGLKNGQLFVDVAEKTERENDDKVSISMNYNII